MDFLLDYIKRYSQFCYTYQQMATSQVVKISAYTTSSINQYKKVSNITTGNGATINYLNYQIIRSKLGMSIEQSDQILATIKQQFQGSYLTLYDNYTIYQHALDKTLQMQ